MVDKLNDLRRKNSFLTSSLQVGMGQVTSQIIFLSCVPILTRIYGPELFGLALNFYSFSVLFGIVSTLRMDIGIVTAPSEKDAATLYLSVISFSVLLCTALALLAWLGTTAGVDLTGIHPIFAHVALLPVMVLAYTAQVLTLAFGNKHRRYGLMSATLVIGSVAMVAYALIAPYFGLTGNGLVEARVFSTWVLAAILMAALRKQIAQGLPLSLRAIWASISVNHRFAFLNVPYSACEALSREWFAIIALAFGRIELAGLFAVVRLALVTPIAVASSSMGQVFFRDALELVGKPELEKRSCLLWSGIGMCILPFFAVLPLHGSVLFGFVFGETWSVAGTLAAIYMPAALMVAYTGFPERIYEVTGRQDLSLRIISSFLLFKCIALTAVFYFDISDFLAVSTNSAIDFLYYSFYLAGLINVANFNTMRVISVIAGSPVILAVVAGFFSIISAVSIEADLPSAAVSLFFAGIVAAAGLLQLWRVNNRVAKA